MLSKPILALTKNRTQKAQTNRYCGDPEDWFDSHFFQEQNIFSTSFDFFVNWEDESISDEVWIKRISDSDNIHNQNAHGLLELISDCDGRDKSNRLYRFLTYQRLAEKYMLYRDIPEREWEIGEEKIVELELSRNGNCAISQFNVDEIQTKISELRKRPAPIGNAGLIYSTSSLEGYLSKQAYFWPGDVDTVLYDENNEVVAIIEFKKHTANSKIPFHEQRITNYLHRDILKYKSLALLRDRLNTNLFVLYYPIPLDIDYVIIEKLEGIPDELYVTERFELTLPNINRDDTLRMFTDNFIRNVLRRLGN